PAADKTRFTLASTVHHLDVLTIDYARPGSGPVVRDSVTPTGNAAANASGIGVTNNTGDLAPTTPTLVSPSDTQRVNTATTTLTATFSDPDPNDSGHLT